MVTEINPSSEPVQETGRISLVEIVSGGGSVIMKVSEMEQSRAPEPQLSHCKFL